MQLYHGDCLEIMAGLPDASVDAVVTDPPYFRVKGEQWDRQWDSAPAFLAWLALVADQWARVLRPNGSVYCFASPDMAARVEVMLRERFNVLNRIRWVKDAGWHKKARKEDLRSYLSPWEEIIFAEHYGADSMALGESGYAAQCEKVRGMVFEPIRAYLAGEFARAGVKTERANAFCNTRSMAARHYFTRSQWCLPTAQHYASLREGLNREGRKPAPPFRDYHPTQSYWARYHPAAPVEYLRADYEYLRADYEDLRRPFAVTAEVPHTDVWRFAPVQPYPGKHPCEKPQALLRHIIRTSTRPGAIILDSFMGKGATGKAAEAEGRDFIGIEREAFYFRDAERRIGEG
jgi:adenine-specific DNA-methyltransferase